MKKVKVGVIGSGFQADVHCASFQIMPEAAEVVAVASPTPGSARALADRYAIARSFLDYREMLREPDIEMVTIALPNDLHARVTRDAAEAGKHVICEKPLCLTLEEADA
jgi:predicted dehydrogenase